jgi:hypothetical protein
MLEPRESETDADAVELEIVSDGRDPAPSEEAERPMPSAAESIRSFRDVIKERFLHWVWRSALFGAAVGFLAVEYRLLRVIFVFWLIYAALRFSFYVFGWRAANRQLVALGAREPRPAGRG